MYPEGIQPVFTLLCDDIRLEVGNRLSFMGVFENLVAERLPVALIKLVVVTRWEGTGVGTTEVRVLMPNRTDVVVATASPATIDLSAGGSNYNLSMFGNVVLPEAGTYWVQTMLDSVVVRESPFTVIDASAAASDQTSYA